MTHTPAQHLNAIVGSVPDCPPASNSRDPLSLHATRQEWRRASGAALAAGDPSVELGALADYGTTLQAEISEARWWHQQASTPRTRARYTASLREAMDLLTTIERRR